MVLFWSYVFTECKTKCFKIWSCHKFKYISTSVGRLKKMPTVKIFINSAQNFQARFSHLVEKALIQPYPVCSHCLLRSLCPPLAHRELRFVTNFWQWTPFCKDGSPNTVGNFSKKSNFSMRKPYTVFPRIVSAETILFWIWPYVLWPLVTVHKSVETIQGRKLFKGGNYSRKYGSLY